jgi:hypothetical protein
MPSGQPRPLTISILKESAGAISIEASKIPHRYEVSAALLEDGLEIARSSAASLFKEQTELMLVPETQTSTLSSASPLALRLRVDGYTRNRTTDEASISFDIDRASHDASRREAIASNWAGVSALGKPMVYDLTGVYPGDSNRKYALQLTVKLAANESEP